MRALDDILRIVACAFPAAGVKALLVGGFAVNHYGYTRNTLDLDLMIAEGDEERVRRIMTEEGFTNRSETSNAIFYQHPDGGLRLDVLTVDETTMAALLANAQPAGLAGVTLAVPALRDVLAMKLFAVTQGHPARADRDLPDIAYLTVLNDLNLERDIKPLCDRFATAEIYKEIVRRVTILRGS